jgi:hypothetical protein
LRGYLEGSKFPLTEIAGKKIPQIILGTHPFDGTTYTSPERDQRYRELWTGPQSMVDLMKPIVQRFGVTASRGFPSDSTLSRWHQEALRLTMEELDMEIAILLGSILPRTTRLDTRRYLYRLSLKLAGKEFQQTWQADPIHQYWFKKRSVTESEIDALIKEATALPLTPPPEWKQVEVDYERLEALLNRWKGFNVPIYASNETWEFLVLAQRFDELQELATLIKKRFGTFLLGTHYAGIIIPMVEAAGIRLDGYSTPVNAAGILMFPTPTLALKALQATTKPIIAIKPLGGGRVPPNLAFPYIFHEIGVHAAMVGIGSIEEAEETLIAAKTALTPSP